MISRHPAEVEGRAHKVTEHFHHGSVDVPYVTAQWKQSIFKIKMKVELMLQGLVLYLLAN